PVCVYRPGLITGNSQTGAWNTDDLTCSVFKSWIQHGYAAIQDAATDMTPVDYVAGAIVHLSRMPESLGKVFHLANPRPVHLPELVRWISSLGYPLKALTYERWRAQLIDLAKRSDEGAWARVAIVLSSGPSGEVAGEAVSRPEPNHPRTVEGLFSVFAAQLATHSVQFNCQNTLEALANTS